MSFTQRQFNAETAEKINKIGQDCPFLNRFDIYQTVLDYHPTTGTYITVMGDKYTPSGEQKWVGAVRIKVDSNFDPEKGEKWVWKFGPY